MKTVMLLSGGVDSSTLLYNLLARGDKVYALTILYGQKHFKEIRAAEKIIEDACLHFDEPPEWNIVDLGKLKDYLKSALTTDEPIPEGHYEAENMKQTVVPNRNAILLNIAAGYALSIGAEQIAYAAHAGDHVIYPDCRPAFVKALEKSIQLGTDSKLKIYAPFIRLHKSDIVFVGTKLKVPYQLTWSCYKGGEKPCGKCGTCVERKEAFEKNDFKDPVEYE